MKLCFCLDDKGGLAFNNRRQSRDRNLIEDLIMSSERVAIFEYSLPLFGEETQNYHLVSCLNEVSENDTLFLENALPDEFLPLSNEIIIYRWNRLYPSDLKFTADVKELGYSLTECRDFVGSSHDKITKEVYKK